jgi:hypothetical protein
MGTIGTICCPKRVDVASETKKETPNDVVNEIMRNKMTPKQIMYDYVYESVKICLIKSDHVEGFFKNRNLFKIPNYEEVNYYYNNFTITNFLGKRSIILVLLQQLNEIKKQDSFLYQVEEINYLETTNESALHVLGNDLKLKSIKNYVFQGIINNSRKLNKVFKLVYKKNNLLGLEANYEVHAHKAALDEDAIKYILGEEKYKHKLLKAIVVDKSLGHKVYYMIFEENVLARKEYDYVILSIEKNMENEYLLIEIAKKLTNFHSHGYRLSSLISEKTISYLILYKEKRDTSEGEETAN